MKTHFEREQWRKIRPILEAARELGRGEREDFLAKACKGDKPLLLAVESYLAAAEEVSDFLEPTNLATLAEGSRLGRYEILELLGAGGMGEVYRARDTRLQREVAIKILPAELAEDAETRSRMEREARILAGLSHPHICTLYDLEHEGGRDLLTMEVLDGETLAQRLEDGPLPLEEALRYGAEIAGALEEAHRHGVIHRDLKPGNVMLTGRGPRSTTKLLDFGIAKALEPSSGGPKETGFEKFQTREGRILGTLHYMSPEQVEGKEIDRRSDLFSFGAMVYEMVTGSRAFPGESQSGVTEAILERDPVPMATLVPATPSALDHLVQRCLAKDPDERWQTASDVMRELEWIAGDGASPTPKVAVGIEPAGRRFLTLAAAAMIALLASGVTWVAMRQGPSEPPPVRRFSINLPDGEVLVPPAQPTFWAPAVSPDGTEVVYVATVGSKRQLVRRRLDRLDGEPIPGTDGALYPFFSPDGRSIGFFAGTKLKTIALDSGVVVELSDATWAMGASWGSDDHIVFSSETTGFFVRRVPASGGRPETLVTGAPPPGRPVSPRALPDGKTILFSAGIGSERRSMALLSLETGERKILAPGLGWGYVPTGHLVYSHSGRLLAAPFDLQRLEITGPPATVSEDRVGEIPVAGVSPAGTVVYVPGGMADHAGQEELVWVDLDGREETLGAEPGKYMVPQLSPSGDKLAVLRIGIGLWIWDLAQETFSRLTFPPLFGTRPVWTPDGSRVAFSSGDGIFWKAADGTGETEALGEAGEILHPKYFTPDGKELIVSFQGEDSRWDLGTLSLEPEARARELLATPANERYPKLSPDGRWLAYQSDETGRYEISVRPYPGVDAGQWQVSTGGGEWPVWGPDGREIFYRDGALMMRVEVEIEPVFRAARPEVLFEGSYLPGHYDISPDGKRFVMVKTSTGGTAPRELIVVENWFEEHNRPAMTD